MVTLKTFISDLQWQKKQHAYLLDLASTKNGAQRLVDK
jgi:hypothetical protein